MNYQFLTIYRKDYVSKKISKIDGTGAKQQFKDPINEGFRHYLTLNEPNVEAPVEDGELYLENTFRKKYKKLGDSYFKEPLAKSDIITSNIVRGLVTEYQTKYCDIVKDIEFRLEGRKQKVVLPNDTVLLETTYKSTFRDPAVVCPTASKRPIRIIPETSLGVNENINKILNVQTGNSAYTEEIGELGEFIIKNQMHGKLKLDCK